MRQTFIILILLFSIHSFGQNNKYVNTELLNIREGAGKNYTVVGQVKQSEKVTIISEADNWTQIETESGIKGFVSSKFLSETNEEPKKKKGSIWTLVLIIGGLILYWLFKSPSSSNTSRNSSRPKSTPKPKPNRWYHCKNCNEKVQSSKMPTGLNCSNSTFHKWTDLGEVGNDAYNCKNCGTTIYTNKMPTGLNCSRDTFHKWTKLS